MSNPRRQKKPNARAAAATTPPRMMAVIASKSAWRALIARGAQSAPC